MLHRELVYQDQDPDPWISRFQDQDPDPWVGRYQDQGPSIVGRSAPWTLYRGLPGPITL